MLKNRKFWYLQGFFVGFCILCIGLSILLLGKVTLHTSVNLSMSMAWNVFLALIAFDFAFLAVESQKISGNIIFGVIWLIFYPNTFYMLTDAKHFVDWLSPEKIYSLSDLRTIVEFNVLIFSIIFGVVLGAWSICLMLNRFIKHLGLRALIVLVISFLGSVGIFVGRSEQLRLNSWDLFFHPLETIRLIFQTINLGNLGFFVTFTLCQCALILLFYLAPRLVSEKTKNN